MINKSPQSNELQRKRLIDYVGKLYITTQRKIRLDH